MERFVLHLSEKISSTIIGKDLIVKGKSKFSDFSNRYELIAYDFKEINPNEEVREIIKELEL
ncbi:MAG: hypothetical protein P8Y70_17010 [Candidatus Lokiarchaeota archaeon]